MTIRSSKTVDNSFSRWQVEPKHAHYGSAHEFNMHNTIGRWVHGYSVYIISTLYNCGRGDDSRKTLPRDISTDVHLLHGEEVLGFLFRKGLFHGTVFARTKDKFCWGETRALVNTSTHNVIRISIYLYIMCVRLGRTIV